MSPPNSDLFEVADIPNAGRGVLATQHISAGTVVLESGPPAVHIIFRQYRKETCAYCFLWNRGRALPIRDNDIGKAFCSPDCGLLWREEQTQFGVEAWQTLARFIASRSKAATRDVDMGDGLMPSIVEIETAWGKVREQASTIGQSQVKRDKRLLQAVRQRLSQPLDSDMLSYFLCGVLLCHQQPDQWKAMLHLAVDTRPYKSKEDLERSCTAYLQLASALPPDLRPHLTPELCLGLVRADNHNAFGVRGGGEDSEEYMGYAVYPSASYFNHSCDPNIFKQRCGRTWSFRAARDIAIGEECCITYLGGDEKDLDLYERQHRLNGNWGFVCICPKCHDEAQTRGIYAVH